MKTKVFKTVSLLLVCMIMFTSGVVAAKLSAKDISFTSTTEGWQADNVEDAVNDLYDISKYEITPGTYFYDSNTSGESIVGYKKVDDKYYLCDKYGNLSSNVVQDVSNLSLVEYVGTSEKDLSVGKAGFSNNNLLLGNGNASDGFKKLVSLNTVGTHNIDVSQYISNYSSKTINNFVAAGSGFAAMGTDKDAYCYGSVGIQFRIIIQKLVF